MERVTRDTDAGETYVEILISLIVFGLIAVALLGALMTSISSSSEHRYLSTDDTLAKAALETVKLNVQQQPPTTSDFIDCSTTNTPDKIIQTWNTEFGLPAAPSHYSIQITGLECWKPTANGGTGAFDGNCQVVNSVPTVDKCSAADTAGLQRVTVTVTDPSGYSLPLSTLIRNSNFQAGYAY